MDTKPSYLPSMLAKPYALAAGANARKTPVASNVVPFVRDDSPLVKKLKAMSAAHAAFWRDDAMQFEQLRKKHGGAKALKLMQAARAVVDEFTLKAGQPNYALAVVVAERDQGKQRENAKQPRPQRSQKNAVRDARIRKASGDGKPRKQIAADEGLTVSQVGRILKPE